MLISLVLGAESHRLERGFLTKNPNLTKKHAKR